MDFKFRIGTKVIFKKGCVKENKEEFPKYGNKCIIVTGRKSGKASGALDDVIDVLQELKIDYTVFDGVLNNPTLENVKEGGEAAAQFGADFVVGIGGGSPLDAAKAVAVLATNDIEPIDLYKNIYDNAPLPILAIPTTAGTGSEVTPYSILTRKDIKTKKSFANEGIFPKVAFMDARYTESMPYSVTVNTAIDALSHAVEGYMSKRSTELSDVLAKESIQIFGQCIDALVNKEIDFNCREKLLYMSMLAGMVISQTGTTMMHSLGYMLTYFKDVPHGKANGLLMKEYFKFNYEAAKDKVDNIMKLLNLKDVNEFGKVMDKLLSKDIELTEEEYSRYASIAVGQKSMTYNPRSVSEEDLVNVLKRSLT